MASHLGRMRDSFILRCALALACLDDEKLQTRYRERVGELTASHTATAPKPRDAKKEVRPTRKRGKR